MNLTFKFALIIKYLALAMLLMINGQLFAVNPVNGFYGGVFLGPTYAPNATFTVETPFSPLSMDGTVHYSIIGNIGGQAGYRFNHFRVEGELFANYNTFKTLKVGDITFNTPYPYYSNITMKGSTTTGAIMANVFYDFYTLGQTVYWSPYLGLGIGYSYIQNTVSFYNANVEYPSLGQTQSSTHPAGQFIIGLGYFLDDFTTVGLDYRYFTTEAASPFNSRTALNSFNITLIGSFDRG